MSFLPKLALSFAVGISTIAAAKADDSVKVVVSAEEINKRQSITGLCDQIIFAEDEYGVFGKLCNEVQNIELRYKNSLKLYDLEKDINWSKHVRRVTKKTKKSTLEVISEIDSNYSACLKNSFDSADFDTAKAMKTYGYENGLSFTVKPTDPSR